MKKYKKILTEIIKNNSTWLKIHEEFTKYNIKDKKIGIRDTRAAKLFEFFCKYYFLTSLKLKDDYRNVWIYEEIPLSVKEKLHFNNDAYKVDLILETTSNKYIAVCCKFKDNETNKLHWTADKVFDLFTNCKKVDEYIVFSNALTLDKTALSRSDDFTYLCVQDLINNEKDTINQIKEFLVELELEERELFRPRLYQKEAINKCVRKFRENKITKGQLILPCGAGKTYVSLWIKEKLQSKSTLVLVPSIALLKQIKNNWHTQRKTEYNCLIVCADKDVDKDNHDSIVNKVSEISGNVTTNTKKIAKFITKEKSDYVIFATYQSLSSITDAIKGLSHKFDFVLCYEAHKIAEIGKKNLINDNNQIAAKKRLYVTATPNIVNTEKNKEIDNDLSYKYAMEDTKIFGKILYQMSLQNAIENEIIVDYKIVISSVNNKVLSEYIEKKQLTNRTYSKEEIASNYLLEQTMKKRNGTRHAVTFHSSISLAKQFSHLHSLLFPATLSFVANGLKHISIRSKAINDYNQSVKAIISNSRCLTETNDIPETGLAYFADPKNNKTDIIKAIGRTLVERKQKERIKGNKRAYIAVPVCYNNELDDFASKAMLNNFVKVISSLCDMDKRLVDMIQTFAIEKDRNNLKKTKPDSNLLKYDCDKFEFIGLENKQINFLFDYVIDKLSNNWDLNYYNFKSYLEGKYKTITEDKLKKLENWFARQKTKAKKGKLNLDKSKKLESFNVLKDKEEREWDKMYAKLLKYSKSSDLEPKVDKNPELGKWYKIQKKRINIDVLRADRKKRIQQINFSGLTFKHKWLALYEKLIEYRKDNPNKWPQYQRHDPKALESKLYIFCYTMRKRYRKNDLGEYWYNKMVEVNFNFEGVIDNWINQFNEIAELIKNRKTISAAEIGTKSYSWITRHKKLLEDGELSEYKKSKIEKLKLGQYFETWEQVFERLKSWVEENGKLPTKIAKNDLYIWLVGQKLKYKKNNLAQNRIDLLASVGVDLDFNLKEKNEQIWQDKLNEYIEFKKLNNTEPSYYKEEEKSLYLWLQAQRAHHAGRVSKVKPMSQKRIDALDAINFQWVGKGLILEKSWDENYKDLQNYIDENGLVKIPAKIDSRSNPLHVWWIRQKIAYNNGTMKEFRKNKLVELNVDILKNKFQD